MIPEDRPCPAGTYLAPCYEIVKDVLALEDFIAWLPDHTEEERYYACLFARKKYCRSVPWLRTDKSQLKRFTTDKARFVDKVRQLECPYGAYRLQGNDVPPEALAVYVTVNPRSLWKATLAGLCDLAAVVRGNGRTSNPQQEVMSSVQRTAGTRTRVLFDVDEKDPDKLARMLEICQGHADVIETRGGYHVVVRSKEMPKTSNWYKELAAFADITGDAMVPVVGCTQGGFVPRFIHRATT